MRRFLIAMLRFVTVFTVIMIGISMVIFIVPEYAGIRENSKGDYSEISKSQIVIAGDSRAEGQLDPALMHQYTSLNTINIAQGAWDLYAVSKSLLTLNVHDKTIILSASSWQANDGSIPGESFRIESFGDLNFAEKIQLYRKDIISLFQRQTRLFMFSVIFKTRVRSFYAHSRNINDGFEKTTCERQISLNDGFFKNHPFYINPEFNGIKKRLLTEALHNLSLLKNCKILIYNGPVTNVFRNAAKKNGVYDLEVTYDNIMRDLVKRYQNMRYVSFIDSRAVSDEHFYDPQHLCETGAHVFTKIIAGEIGR